VLNQEPPLSLYIHLPWCVKKCPYCDFNSHEFRSGALAETEYVDALLRDIEFELPRITDRQITSVFIGGGTPSLFSAEALERLLSAMRSQLNIRAGIEMTLEANPGTAEAGRFQAYHEIGINRLSIGVQSFDDEKLSKLGRIHNANEALQAIQMAREAGFENINIDLMFALPGQGIDEAMQDLQRACSQPVTHISWYQLTIEPNTVFYKQRPVLPVDDAIWEMQTQGQGLLADKDYGQYEISAYAMPGRQCQHNLNYWQFGDYLGIGAGAHGKLSDKDLNQIRRFARHRLPDRYMQKAGSSEAIVEERELQQDDIILEFMMNAFRLREGFSHSLFSTHTGLSIEEIRPLLDRVGAHDFILQDKEHIKATKKGRDYLNELLQIFMPADKQ
jgi:putative oxygen-independent coproporphyrinogen III oxidase